MRYRPTTLASSPKRLAALLACVALLAAGPAVARPGSHERSPLRGIERALPSLELDVATEAQVYELLDAARGARRDQRAAIREAHVTLRTLLEQDAPDRDLVLVQAEVIGDLALDARKADLEVMLEVRALLPEDTRARLAELAGERRERRESRFEEGCEGHRGRGAEPVPL